MTHGYRWLRAVLFMVPLLATGASAIPLNGTNDNHQGTFANRPTCQGARLRGARYAVTNCATNACNAGGGSIHCDTRCDGSSWNIVSCDGTGNVGAPTGAGYWTDSADGQLSQERNLGGLATGLVINTAGVPSAYPGSTCAAGLVPNTISALGVFGGCVDPITNFGTDPVGILPQANGGFGVDAAALANGYVKKSAGTMTTGPIAAADLPTSIDPTKLSPGTVDATELGYLNGVTGALQGQLDAKAAASSVYTKTELNTSDGDGPNAGSNRVSWNNLTDVPAGFADGTDDGSGVGASTIVQDEGADLASQPQARLNFTGAGVACATNVVDGRTDCTIPGGGSTSFAALTSGTNTQAAALIGTGASLGTTGSGTIAATTAAALATNPADCATNQYATTIAANGNLSCAQVNFSQLGGVATDAQIPDTITVNLAAAANALSSNGANCPAGFYAGGVSATGVAEGCTLAGNVVGTGPTSAGNLAAFTDTTAGNVGRLDPATTKCTAVGDPWPCCTGFHVGPCPVTVDTDGLAHFPGGVTAEKQKAVGSRLSLYEATDNGGSEIAIQSPPQCVAGDKTITLSTRDCRFPASEVDGALRVLNVTDYGAVCDGTTNDRAAIQAAVDACTVAGGFVAFPEGKTCAIASTVTVGSRCTLGSLGGSAVLLATTTMSPMIDFRVSGARGNGGGLQNLWIDGNDRVSPGGRAVGVSNWHQWCSRISTSATSAPPVAGPGRSSSRTTRRSPPDSGSTT